MMQSNDVSRPRRQGLCRLAALAAWAAAGLPGGARAWGDPAPPLCGQAPPPAWPAADQPALVQTWLQGGRLDGPAPDCSGLRSREFELLVRLTASYQAPGELADQLARFGEVSHLKGLTYWSFTDRKRQVLVRESYAVDKPATMAQRADYTLAELRSGRELYYAHGDNRSSALVPYGMQLLQLGDNGFQLRIENVGEVRFMGFTVVGVREMQWVLQVERLGNGRWGYRSLMGLQRLRLGPADKHRQSNLARCVAIFDLIAGRQTDIEPYR